MAEKLPSAKQIKSVAYKGPAPCFKQPFTKEQADQIKVSPDIFTAFQTQAIDTHLVDILDILKAKFGPAPTNLEAPLLPEGALLPPYYHTDETTIQVATPTQPANPDVISNTTAGTPGYQQEQIFQSTGRIAPQCTLSNDGTTDLFAITSIDGKIWSAESVIHRGEFRRFFDVYELRIRGPEVGRLNFAINADINNATGATLTTMNQGGVYRISEHLMEVANLNVNRTAIFVVSATVVGPPGAGYTAFTITAPLVNTTSAFRANVNNTDVVFYTYKGGDTTLAAERGTLNPGDVLKASLTQGGQVFFSGNIAGQIVELTIESDITVP